MKIFVLILSFLYLIKAYDSNIPILQDDYKTDVEYIFEKGQNFSQIYEVIFHKQRMKIQSENIFISSKKMKSI